MASKNPSPPVGLGKDGRAFWREVVKGWDCNPDTLRLLERAARVLDTLAVLDQELESAELILEGSRGQPIANPLMTERRLHSQVFAQLVRQLRLEEAEAGGWEGLSISERGRKAALQRWRKSPQ